MTGERNTVTLSGNAACQWRVGFSTKFLMLAACFALLQKHASGVRMVAEERRNHGQNLRADSLPCVSCLDVKHSCLVICTVDLFFLQIIDESAIPKTY